MVYYVALNGHFYAEKNILVVKWPSLVRIKPWSMLCVNAP